MCCNTHTRAFCFPRSSLFYTLSLTHAQELNAIQPQIDLINESSHKWSPVLPQPVCLAAFLFSCALIIHLTPSPSERGQKTKNKKKTHLRFHQKQNQTSKERTGSGGGLQPRESSSCEIGARWAWSQRFRWKIPLQVATEITKTPLPSAAQLFLYPLTPSHYSLPPSLIHLSGAFFYYRWLHLSLPYLYSFITGLTSNSFIIHLLYLNPATEFLPLPSCSFLPLFCALS